MTLELLRQEEGKIIKQIDEIKWKGLDIKPISDGIINIEEYLASDLKILWINKEVYSTEEDADWNLRHELANLEENGKVKSGWAGTFNPLIYTIYGIINNKKWHEMKWIEEDPMMIKVLEKIAYINVKKVPGGSVANNSELREFHNEFGSILKRQIQLYNPDIIICGNTYSIIEKSLTEIYDIDRKMNFKIDNSNSNNVFFKNEKVIIVDAYHPNCKQNKEEYCNGIINGVLEWDKNRKK